MLYVELGQGCLVQVALSRLDDEHVNFELSESDPLAQGVLLMPRCMAKIDLPLFNKVEPGVYFLPD